MFCISWVHFRSLAADCDRGICLNYERKKLVDLRKTFSEKAGFEFKVNERVHLLNEYKDWQKQISYEATNKWKKYLQRADILHAHLKWMSELMQFTIHYFILDQINNDNYNDATWISVGMKKTHRMHEKKQQNEVCTNWTQEQKQKHCTHLLSEHWVLRYLLHLRIWSCEIDEKWKELCVRTVAQRKKLKHRTKKYVKHNCRGETEIGTISQLRRERKRWAKTKTRKKKNNNNNNSETNDESKCKSEQYNAMRRSK